MASELHVDAIKHSGGTSALTIDSSGRVATPARPAFMARRTSNQSAGTVVFDTVMTVSYTHLTLPTIYSV